MEIHLKRFVLETQGRILILSAGLPRSGSTWLYNAIRLSLLSSQLTRSLTSYGYVQDLPMIEKRRIMLVKIHNYNEDVIKMSVPKIIFYSHRDIRDCLASAKRVWKREPSIVDAENYIQHDALWRACADFVMRYETMIENPTVIMTGILDVLQVDDVEGAEIIRQISELRYESPGSKNEMYNLENQLHKGHFTDGRHGTWGGVLAPELIEEIESKYRGWFIQNNYPLSLNS